MSKLGDEHRSLLRAALEGDLSEKTRDAFDEMLRTISSREGRFETLSKAQADWVRRSVEEQRGPEFTRLTDAEIPAGRAVEVPLVLRAPLPLRPPGGRA